MHFLGILWHFAVLSCFAGQRVVTTSPALTELAFQLGAGNQLVAASEFSDVPEEAKKLPRVGSLFHPSIEKTIQLKPDLVLIDSFTLNPSYLQAVQALHLKFKVLRIESLEKLMESSEWISKELGLVDNTPSWKVEIESLKARAKPFTFLVLTWLDPAIGASRTTFLSSLLTLIGGENLIPPTIQAPYLPLSREWLLQNKPDFVFVLQGMDADPLSKASALFPGGKTKAQLLPAEYFSRTNYSGIQGLHKIVEKLWN